MLLINLTTWRENLLSQLYLMFKKDKFSQYKDLLVALYGARKDIIQI